MNTDLPTLADELRRIARDAGARIMDLYGAQADWKSDGSPVTAADHAAQEVITAGLHAITPNVPVLSEEGKTIEYPARKNWARLWVVDPLDGTKEFLKQSGEFTVNIALVENGEPVLGIVHAPAIDASWVGHRGGPALAFRGDERTIIRCSAKAASPVRLAVSRDHLGESEKALMDHLAPTEIVSAGSSLKFCLIAEGRADLYPRFVPTMEWDTAAAQAVLEAAGGQVTDRAGAPLQYNRENLRNPPIVAWADRDLFAAVLAYESSATAD